jgi:hypothetical protein
MDPHKRNPAFVLNWRTAQSPNLASEDLIYVKEQIIREKRAASPQ